MSNEIDENQKKIWLSYLLEFVGLNTKNCITGDQFAAIVLRELLKCCNAKDNGRSLYKKMKILDKKFQSVFKFRLLCKNVKCSKLKNAVVCVLATTVHFYQKYENLTCIMQCMEKVTVTNQIFTKAAKFHIVLELPAIIYLNKIFQTYYQNIEIDPNENQLKTVTSLTEKLTRNPYPNFQEEVDALNNYMRMFDYKGNKNSISGELNRQRVVNRVKLTMGFNKAPDAQTIWQLYVNQNGGLTTIRSIITSGATEPNLIKQFLCSSLLCPIDTDLGIIKEKLENGVNFDIDPVTKQKFQTDIPIDAAKIELLNAMVNVLQKPAY